MVVNLRESAKSVDRVRRLLRLKNSEFLNDHRADWGKA